MDLRKNFGAEQARHRRNAGLTQEQLAKLMGYVVKTIQHAEQGLRTPTLEYAQKADDALGLDGVLANLASLCRDDGSPFGSFLAHEARATVIRTYVPQVIPGLLQTSEYADAVIRAADPTDDPEESLRVRIGRQRALAREDPPRYHVVLSEAALWQEIGGPEVFFDQLRRLTELPHNVVVQVLPFTRGAHSGVDGAITLMEFAGEAPVVTMEGWRLSAIMDDTATVKRAREALDMLMAAALDPETSAAMIEAQMEYYR